jgi:hypothetical protein
VRRPESTFSFGVAERSRNRIGHQQPPLFIYTSFAHLADLSNTTTTLFDVKREQIASSPTLLEHGWLDMLNGQARDSLSFSSYACASIHAIAALNEGWAQSDLRAGMSDRFARILLRTLRAPCSPVLLPTARARRRNASDGRRASLRRHGPRFRLASAGTIGDRTFEPLFRPRSHRGTRHSVGPLSFPRPSKLKLISFSSQAARCARTDRKALRRRFSAVTDAQ